MTAQRVWLFKPDRCFLPELKRGVSTTDFLGMRNGLIVGLIIGLIMGIRRGKQSIIYDIHTVESLRWSWASARKAGIWGSVVATIGVLIVLLMLGPIVKESEQLWEWRIRALVAGLSGGLIGMFIGGLNSRVVKRKAVPNQGIKLSIRNMAFVGVIEGLIFSTIGGGIAEILGMQIREVYGWRYGMSIGLTVGVVASLWFGGFDVIQHYILRCMLYLKGYMPLNYAHFLDYAAERIFLRKVGGGYIFIHRLLLEHFAAMDEIGE